MTIEQVREIHDSPLQTALRARIRTETPLLMELDMAVLGAPQDKFFITSDYPCVWYDPTAYKRPPFYRSPGLGYSAIEVTLPISPRQIAWLNRQGIGGYRKLSGLGVDALNSRARYYADKFFVVNSNKLDPAWLEVGVEPDDSWDKTHKNKDVTK